jgi:hypothetical protein
MTDYGHPITFGLSLYPSVDQLNEIRRLAQAADAAGLDYLAIQDHAYSPEFLDVWTLITYLAAETERVSFLTGDVEAWVTTLTDWSIDLGFDTFVFWPMTEPVAQLEIFAREVVPAVRQRVAERRGQP